MRSPFLATFLVLVAFAAGAFATGQQLLPDSLLDVVGINEENATRSQLIDSIEDDFYKKVDDKKLEEASLKGIVDSLNDRFSHYFTPEETKVFEQSITDPEFEGIGVSVAEDKRGLRIVQVFDGSPAKKAGLTKEDVITEVAGKSIAGQSSDVSTAKIKGKPGTSVRLTVLAGGSKKKKRTVEVERASIEVPIVEAEMERRNGAKLGYVRLLSFTSGVHGELREKIDELLDKGAEGVLLDLRGNGGGLLREAVLVSSVFIEDGTIVTTKGRRRPKREFEAEGDAIDKDIPVVVLVDRGTASASEIVSGALRDSHRGTLAGERTFGKGVFQELEPLSNGGALDLTVGSYYLPSGENISRTGIMPKVKARDRPRTRRDEALPIAIDTLVEKIE